VVDESGLISVDLGSNKGPLGGVAGRSGRVEWGARGVVGELALLDKGEGPGWLTGPATDMTVATT
jgi:hypothetical protein